MPKAPNSLSMVMRSVYNRTRQFLLDEMGMVIDEVVPRGGDARTLLLRDMTTIIGLEGPLSLAILFSYQDSLLDELFRKFTADISVPEDERDLYRRETAAEIANTILGLCTGEICPPGQKILMTPPVIIEQGKAMHPPRHSVFASLSIQTSSGGFDINFVGSRETFLETSHSAKK